MKGVTLMQRLIGVATVATLAATLTAPTSTANNSGQGRIVSSPIEGRWKGKRFTVQELVAAGLTRKNAEALVRLVKGTPGLDLRNGRYKGLNLDTGRVGSTGTYRLSGNVVTFIFRTGAAVDFGRPYLLHWSVYRDRLTFSAVPGRPPLRALILQPWIRVT